MRSRITALVLLLATVVVITVAIETVLKLPGIPYNVAELFLDSGSVPRVALFALAVLWIGAGAMLLAHWLAVSRYPYVILPLGAIILAMVSRTLLKYSVTYESLDDILGTSNLFYQVTAGNMWGEFWKHAFLVANAPDLIEYVERRSRFIALYSPLSVGLAFALLPVVRETLRRKAPAVMSFLWLGIVAVLWLWFCKIITINWAATDNVTELISATGPLGLGGGPYLYLLVALMAVNVALLVQATEKWRWWAMALVFSAAAVPISWTLLQRGLEAHIVTHGPAYSGVQFLLGPDRNHALSQTMLFLRWVGVEVSGVAVMFVGAWIGHALAGRGTRPRIVS